MIRVVAAVAVSAAVFGVTATARSADLATTLQTMGTFDRFIEAARAVGLFEELRDGGVYCSNGCTIFAPTDDAFAGVTLPDDDGAARAIIQQHVLPQEFRISDMLRSQGAALTYNLGSLSYSGIADRGLRVGDAQIVRGDVDANNGVIHIVDRVLLP